VQKTMAEDRSIDIKQSSSDRNKVLGEFNRLLEEFLAKSSTVQDLKHLGSQNGEMTALDNEVTAEGTIIVRKPLQKYTHIQLGQGIIAENTPIAAYMAQTTEVKVKNRSKEAQRTQAFFSLISQLEEPVKEEFMEKIIDFACNIQYEDLRSEILSQLISIMDGPRKIDFIQKVLYATSDIQDEDKRALVLSSLARHLRGRGKEELIEHIFDFSSKIQSGDAKFQILSSLVPHLSGSKNEAIMEKALELVSGIISEYQRIESFSLLLPYMDEQRKEEIIEQALELALNLRDKDVRPQALSLMIPYLDESRQKEIIEKAAYLGGNGIQFEYLHRRASAILRRSEALSSLAPYLDISCSISS